MSDFHFTPLDPDDLAAKEKGGDCFLLFISSLIALVIRGIIIIAFSELPPSFFNIKRSSHLDAVKGGLCAS